MLTKRFSRNVALLTMMLGAILARPALAAPADTATTVASSPNPSTAGTSVNITATVTSGTAGIDGTVTVTVDGTPVGSNPVTTAGKSVTSAPVPFTFATAGAHTVEADFTATVPANFNNSAGTLVQLVKSTTSFSAFTASPAGSSTYGQSVTFSATITGSFGNPTGTVQFQANGNAIGPPVSLAASGGVSGIASYTTSALPAGSAYAISGVYSGDTYNSGSTGTLSGGYTVNKDNTNVSTPTSSSPTSTLGQTVTISAIVSAATGGASAPTGTVTFSDGTFNATAPVTSGGLASISTSALTVGSHSLKATYNGDSNFNTATSAALTQTVSRATPTVALTSSPNPSIFNSSVTFTATVSGGGLGTPTGSVVFTVDGVAKPAAALSAGVATLSLSTLAVGNHNVTASYSGDTNFSPADSNGLTQIVNGGAASTTNLTSAPNPSDFGTSVTFTATVAGTGGTPGGQVTFKDTFNGSTNNIGTGTLDGTGTATFTTSTLAVGSHTITAVYAGDSTFTGSASSPLTQTVNQAANTTVIISSSPSAAFGDSVTFTATVNGTSSVPTGTITFSDGATSIGSAQLTPTGFPDEASTTFTTSLLAVGVHTITAAYGGDINNGSSSSSLTQTITQATPTVTIATDINPSTLNQTVTFTATIAAINGVQPTGTAQFQDNGTDIGSPQNVSGGQATLPIQTLAVGAHTIKAVYSGDTTYTTASGSLTQTVSAAASTTKVTADINPSPFNSTVTFTVTVTGPGATPTGTVAVLDGGVQIGTGALGADGKAAVAITGLAVGVHSITASYSGDTNFGTSASAPPLAETVNKGATAVALASSANPSNFSDTVKFTATVTAPGGGGTPSGSVTFMDGSTPIGNTNLDATGIASFQTAALTAGTHKITAVYSSDSKFAAATSTILSQVVNQSASSVSISSSVNPSAYRQAITYTVTVIGKVTPTGTVTFLDDGKAITDAANPANVAPSGVSGQASASFTFPGLTVGKHTITAMYSGDSSNGSGAQSLTQNVSQTTATVSVSSNNTQPASGDAIVFTAKVTVPSGGASPTGTIQFQDGATKIGTPQTLVSGQATLTISSLSVGTHTINAVYSGDGNYSAQQGSLAQTVFDRSTTITTISPSHLLVPGSLRPSLGTVIKTSDPQVLTITGTGFAPGATVLFKNQTPGATLPIDGQRLTPDATPVTDSHGVSTLTVTVPPALAATAGIVSIEVDNPSPQPSKVPGVFSGYPINPVQAIQTIQIGSSAYLRMISLPYDYTGISPYAVLEGVQLTTSSAKAYDPDLNNLLGVTLFSDATLLPLYHWDPQQGRYLATVSQGTGLTPDNLQLILGQAFWAVGSQPSAALIGVMRLGTPAAYNPSGIPLQQGWNMVGDPFPTDAAMASLQVLYQGATLPFYGSGSGVSNGIVSPIFWSYEQNSSGAAGYQINYDGLTGHQTLRAYEGYWVYCYQPCTLLVTK